MHGQWTVSAVGTVVQLAGTAGLLWSGLRLRRRSGFRRSQLRELDSPEKRHIVRWLAATTLAQTLLIALLVWTCVRIEAEPLIWPSIGAVVSLHFAPLGRIFHVRTYYVTAVAGTIISAAGFVISGTSYGTVTLGAGLAMVMWGSAAYILLNADRIAGQACAEHWAV